jgi:hypothetical protein
MTLIVFDFKVPAVAQANQLNLRHELIQLWTRFEREWILHGKESA